MTGAVRTLGYAHPFAATTLAALRRAIQQPCRLIIAFALSLPSVEEPDKLSKELLTATVLRYRYPIKLGCKPKNI